MAPSMRGTSRVEKATASKTKRNTRSKSTKLQKRLLAELHTEGTGLKGEFPERKQAVYYRGAWYENEDGEQQPSPQPEARRRRRTRDHMPAPEPVSKRTRRASRKVRENNANRTPPRSAESEPLEMRASPDEVFLRETTRQLHASRAAKSSIRWRKIEQMLPFLDVIAVPVIEDTPLRVGGDDEPDAEGADLYVLDQTEARRLLGSNREIQIPVFVPDGAQPVFDTETDDRRPIEQIFDYFHDPAEEDETTDTSRRPGTNNALRDLLLSDVRDRFLSPPADARTYPFNFPDIPNPMLETGVPTFMQTPKTGLLKTLIRNLLPIDPRTVCPENCPHATHASLRCARHRLSGPELVHLQSGWLHWQSTLMLAEPGALTHRHWDKWGFGTWVTCHEGEMAFAWMSRPGDEERRLWQVGGEEAVGRWVFVVLRPGDALFMPSGTVHLVFRRPEGGPTLGLAGHVVRSPDLVAWLRALMWEVEDEIRNPDADVPYGDVVPCLLAGLKSIIKRDDMFGREIDGYGGQENLEKARGLLEEIENMIDDL